MFGRFRGVFGVATVLAILVVLLIVFLVRLQLVLLVNVLLSLIADGDCDGREDGLVIASYVFPALLSTNYLLSCWMIWVWIRASKLISRLSLAVRFIGLGTFTVSSVLPKDSTV